MKTHILRFERKAKNGREIVAWAWCGWHERVAERVVIRPTVGRPYFERRAYSLSFKPELRPQAQYVHAELAHFSNCDGCKVGQANRKPGRPHGAVAA